MAPGAGQHTCPVHPAGAGEHDLTVAGSLVSFIPAKAREHGLSQAAAHRPRRFIPKAGNTGCWPLAAGLRRLVHPRERGEHFCDPDRFIPRRRTASIPASAGNTLRCGALCPPIRFIPASAGNTSSSAGAFKWGTTGSSREQAGITRRSGGMPGRWDLHQAGSSCERGGTLGDPSS